MVKRVAFCVGAMVLATLAANEGLAAIPNGGATGAVASVISVEVPCPPYDALPKALVHRAPRKPRLIPAVDHTVPLKPVAAVVRRRPVHHVARPAFETPRFLDAAVEHPGRCMSLQRGPAGPALISYLPVGPGLPDAGAGDVPAGDAVAPAPPGDASLPATGGPVLRQSALLPPGGFFGGVPQDQPPVGGPTTAPVPPVSDVPEPGAWALMLTGLFGVGSALRRRRMSAGEPRNL